MKHLTPLSMTRLSCSLRAKPPCSSHAHRFSSVRVHWNLLRCDFWRKGFYLHYRVFISDGNRTSWHTFLPFPLPERLHQVFLLKFLFYLIHKSLSQNFHWMKKNQVSNLVFYYRQQKFLCRIEPAIEFVFIA